MATHPHVDTHFDEDSDPPRHEPILAAFAVMIVAVAAILAVLLAAS